MHVSLPQCLLTASRRRRIDFTLRHFSKKRLRVAARFSPMDAFMTGKICQEKTLSLGPSYGTIYLHSECRGKKEGFQNTTARINFMVIWNGNVRCIKRFSVWRASVLWLLCSFLNPSSKLEVAGKNTIAIWLQKYNHVVQFIYTRM